jgi:hypothetical protein
MPHNFATSVPATPALLSARTFSLNRAVALLELRTDFYSD